MSSQNQDFAEYVKMMSQSNFFLSSQSIYPALDEPIDVESSQRPHEKKEEGTLEAKLDKANLALQGQKDASIEVSDHDKRLKLIEMERQGLEKILDRVHSVSIIPYGTKNIGRPFRRPAAMRIRDALAWSLAGSTVSIDKIRNDIGIVFSKVTQRDSMMKQKSFFASTYVDAFNSETMQNQSTLKIMQKQIDYISGLAKALEELGLNNDQIGYVTGFIFNVCGERIASNRLLDSHAELFPILCRFNIGSVIYHQGTRSVTKMLQRYPNKAFQIDPNSTKFFADDSYTATSLSILMVDNSDMSEKARELQQELHRRTLDFATLVQDNIDKFVESATSSVFDFNVGDYTSMSPFVLASVIAEKITNASLRNDHYRANLGYEPDHSVGKKAAHVCKEYVRIRKENETLFDAVEEIDAFRERYLEEMSRCFERDNKTWVVASDERDIENEKDLDRLAFGTLLNADPETPSVYSSSTTKEKVSLSQVLHPSVMTGVAIDKSKRDNKSLPRKEVLSVLEEDEYKKTVNTVVTAFSETSLQKVYFSEWLAHPLAPLLSQPEVARNFLDHCMQSDSLNVVFSVTGANPLTWIAGLSVPGEPVDSEIVTSSEETLTRCRILSPNTELSALTRFAGMGSVLSRRLIDRLAKIQKIASNESSVDEKNSTNRKQSKKKNQKKQARKEANLSTREILDQELEAVDKRYESKIPSFAFSKNNTVRFPVSFVDRDDFNNFFDDVVAKRNFLHDNFIKIADNGIF